MIASLLFGKLMHRFKKNDLLYFTLICCGVSTILFGMLIETIKHKKVFVVLSVIMRMINGFSCGAIKTVILSILPLLFPAEELTSVMTKLQITFSLSIISSTIIGGTSRLRGYWPLAGVNCDNFII